MLKENRKSEVTKRVYIYKEKQTKVIQIVLYKVSLINFPKSSFFLLMNGKAETVVPLFFGFKKHTVDNPW